jgi:hypothetical protein
MANPFSFPDIAALNRRLREDGSATTSANVGAYERPLGTPIPATPVRRARVTGAGGETSDRFFDAEDYLRRMRGE